MKQLPHWSITDKFPAFYDTESATAIEQTAKIYAKMQELINEVNKFIDEVNAYVVEFGETTETNAEEFAVGLRQEFQDFIDVIDLKVTGQDQEIANAIQYMKDNLDATMEQLFADALSAGTITVAVAVNYDSETESMTISLSEGE